MDNNFIKQKVRELLTEDNVYNSFNKILDVIRTEARKLNDDDAYELHEKLKAWFNKLLETTIIDKNTNINDPVLKNRNPETIKTALDTAKKTNKPVTIAEEEEDIVKLSKILDSLNQTNKEIETLYKKYQGSEEEIKSSLVDKIKDKLKVRKELETIRDQKLNK